MSNWLSPSGGVAHRSSRLEAGGALQRWLRLANDVIEYAGGDRGVNVRPELVVEDRTDLHSAHAARDLRRGNRERKEDYLAVTLSKRHGDETKRNASIAARESRLAPGRITPNLVPP